MTRRIAVILNPSAGRGRAAATRVELERLLSEVQSSGTAHSADQIEIVETSGPRNAGLIASTLAAQGVQIIAAAGGDGTLNEVLNGLVGSMAALAVIPLGTGNDFARFAGVGPDLRQAVETVLYGDRRQIDIGKIGDRYFINVAGCGFDAVVAHRVNRGYRFLRGTAAYVAAVLQTLFVFRPADFRIIYEGGVCTRKGMLCAAANASMYGGGMRIAPNARVDDGLFDLCVLGAAGKLEFLCAFPRVFAGRHITHPKVTMLQARTVRIESDPPMPVLIDGEIYGTTPADFSMIPAGIPFLFPPTCRRRA